MPWARNNQRKSWISDTTVTAALFLAVLIATVITDYTNGPEQQAPAYLTGLLGASGMILFGAAGSEKSKRDRTVSDTAERAEAKVDKLAEVAESQHPGSTTELHNPPFQDGVS